MCYEDHVKFIIILRLLKGFFPPGVPIESALIANVCAMYKIILSDTKQDDFGVERLVGITTEAATTLLDESSNDAQNGKMFEVALNDPEFMGFHKKQLHTMLVEAL